MKILDFIIFKSRCKFIFEMEKMMKEKYKLTIPDKIEKFKDKLDMLNTFIDILN